MRDPARNGARGIGKEVESRRAIPLLAELNITRDQSSDWQKLAAIPRKQFESELSKPGIPTTQPMTPAQLRANFSATEENFGVETNKLRAFEGRAKGKYERQHFQRCICKSISRARGR